MTPVLARSLAGVMALAILGCGSERARETPVPTAPQMAAGADAPLKGPDHYRVKFETTKGDFVVQVHREWSPYGADRFHELIKGGVYDNAKFFRAVKGFMVQFGIAADPKISTEWREKFIPDDPVVKSNLRGYVTFAKPSMPNSRTTQVFINTADNARLDAMGFSPFGEIVEGMDVVDALNTEYGEETTQRQMQIYAEGNAFLEKEYPNLDGIKRVTVIE
ncbi:MAG TPA: peptidylprolyl isomerase [Planctomycetaceae bacterium]|jgi:peptidyl-prolyl cis-trans isomerase A (cyclophilin A)|nr:peptidylprolyl isomerase [Planctomycetaceae bacterium]